MIYIATIWILRAESDESSIWRFVIRKVAKNPVDFAASVCDDYMRNVDDEITFGPISISKRQ